MTHLTLLQAEPSVAAQAYEALLLESLDAPEPPIQRWRAAYVRLSEALTSRRAETLSKSASGLWGGNDERAVAALIFGQRTFLALRHIVRAYPVPAGPLLDWGSGSGAASLAVATTGATDVALTDASTAALELAQRMLQGVGVTPALLSGESRTPATGAYAALIAAHSLNEWRTRHGGRSYGELLGSWLGLLRPGGRLYVLEPGLFETARALQEAREHLRDRARIVAPCTHAAPCPLLSSSRDWCHMTWPLALGAIARDVMAATGHVSEQTTLSWLVLEQGPPISTSQARLLQVRPSGKGKLIAHVCREEGAQSWVALDRGPLGARFRALQAGEVLTIDPSGLKQRGDGLRVDADAELEQIRPL